MYTRNSITSTISNSYSTGSVSGGISGGLVGSLASGTIVMVINSYWDTETSNQSTSSGGGIGKTTTELQVEKTTTNLYSTWDNLIWDFSNGYYPQIKKYDSVEIFPEKSYYVNWDFDNDWEYNENSYPTYSSFLLIFNPLIFLLLPSNFPVNLFESSPIGSQLE